MFRALSAIIDFGRLQTLQGDEPSLEPSQLVWNLIETGRN